MTAFIIPGKPVAKGRPRFSNGRAYTPAVTKAFEKKVRLCALRAGVEKIDGPVDIRIVAVFSCPKADYRKRKPAKRRHHLGKPDLSNVVKAVEDGLNGVLYNDDSQIARTYAQKFVGAQDEPAHTLVQAEPSGEGSLFVGTRVITCD